MTVRDERKSSPDYIADPTRDLRSGLIVALFFFVVFLGWAAVARLDAAAYAQGALVVSGERQSVEHRDGGLVGAIYVHEGDRVKRGQLLLQLAASEVRAQERADASQAIRLLAQRARLEAEQTGRSRITPPVEFMNLEGADKSDAAKAMQLQQVELRARTSVLSAQRGVLGARAGQSYQQARGYSDQEASTREQLRLIDEQIAALKPVAEKGFVSQTRMRELQRARADLEGRRGQLTASVSQTQGARHESQIQALEAERNFLERAAANLREVESSLGDVLPKWVAARDQLERTSIRAPATGAVVGLSIFTVGGVVKPGQKLMEIVPEKAPLRIQVRISPDDADDVVIGQSAKVKITGLHERTIPNLTGYVTRLSADSFVDDKTGQNFFTGEVTVPLSQLQLIQAVRGNDFNLRAGMPVQVLIPLSKRSAFDYMIEPLVGSFWHSFGEH